ncbi:hypothetical protein ACFLXO_05665 [Chloroflexota bacterium]
MVRFFDEKGYSVDATAFNVSSTSLTVSVPFYIDMTTGEFGPGVVSVKLVQDSTTDTLYSNTIDGFQIEDLASFTEPTGSITIAYLDGIIQCFQDAKAHLISLEEFYDRQDAYPELIVSLDLLLDNYIAVKTEVESIIADPTKSVIFAQIGDDNLEMNITTISLIDSFVGSVVQQMVPGSIESTALNIDNGDYVLVGSKQVEPNFVPLNWIRKEPNFTFLNWTQKETDLVPVQSKEENPLSLSGLDVSGAIQRAERWSSWTSNMAKGTSLYYEYTHKLPAKVPALEKVLGPIDTMSSLYWTASTAIPATMVLYEDLSAITAGTSKEAFNQAKPAVDRYINKVGPKLVDMMISKVPVWAVTKAGTEGIIHICERVGITPKIEDVSGRGTLLTEIRGGHLIREEGYDRGRPDPNLSGLDLVRGISPEKESTRAPPPPPPPPAPPPPPTTTPTTPSSLTGTWTISTSGSFNAHSWWLGGEHKNSGAFGRDFTIAVTQENNTLRGKGTNVSVGQAASLVGEVKDGSGVTFTIHENFPIGGGGSADMVHAFTGTVAGQKITGTFTGGCSRTTENSGITYQISGKFTVSVGP